MHPYRKTREAVEPHILDISLACDARGMPMTEIAYQSVGFYVWFLRDGVPNSIYARDVDDALARLAVWPRETV